MADNYSEFTQVTNSAGQPVMAPRFNNPGNLKDMKTGKFRTFTTPEEGYAALDQDLTAKGAKGFNTVSSIINRYAPPSDNNPTASYIANVARALKVGPNDRLDMNNPLVISTMRNAMVTQEGNRNIQPSGSTPTAQTAPTAAANPYAEFQAGTAPQYSAGSSFGRGLIQGATLGTAPYFGALSGWSQGQPYGEALAEQKAQYAGAHEANPTASIAGGLVSGLPTMFATGGAGAARLLPQIKQGIGIGAGSGAIAGAAGSDTWADVPANAAIGAGIGGTIGLAAPLLVSGAKSIPAVAKSVKGAFVPQVNKNTPDLILSKTANAAQKAHDAATSSVNADIVKAVGEGAAAKVNPESLNQARNQALFEQQSSKSGKDFGLTAADAQRTDPITPA